VSRSGSNSVDSLGGLGNRKGFIYHEAVPSATSTSVKRQFKSARPDQFLAHKLILARVGISIFHVRLRARQVGMARHVCNDEAELLSSK
jgi:hypothetical protein